jgi:bacteriocin-like protein
MKTLDLENMGLETLSHKELMEIEGGGFWDILGNIAGALAVVGLFVGLVAGSWVVLLAGAVLIVAGGAAAAVAQVLDENGLEYNEFMAGLNDILPWQA